MNDARVHDEEGLQNEEEDTTPVVEESSGWERRARLASNLSLFVNLILLVSNALGAYVTGSLALVSTAADSFLDLLSQLIIAAAMRGNTNVDKDLWPLGRSRLEPVGLIVVSSLMGIAAFQILMESAIRITEGVNASTPPTPPKFEIPSIVMISVAIGIKAVLFVMCWSVSKHSSSMAVLAEDHRNDVLSNIVALATGLLSNAVPSGWYLDPTGAILISLYICIRWVLVGREQALMLIGKAAHPDFLESIKALASSHHNGMEVDVLRAYHFGHKYLVEVEVVVPPETNIVFAHDAALALQKKIELLEEVERAHVHVDYEHREEDEHKQTFHAIVRKQPTSDNNLGLHRRHQRYTELDNSTPADTVAVAGI